MVNAAVALLERRGLAAMSFSDIVADSGAARGAIYHHFPGGKLQLAGEAAAATGTQVRDFLAALPGATPRAVVAAVTVDIGEPDAERTRALQTVAHTAFSAWSATLAANLIAAGLAPARAND